MYSYGNTIAVGFAADRAMLPDPDAFAAALRGAFEGLRAGAMQPPSMPPVTVDTGIARKPKARKGAK